MTNILTFKLYYQNIEIGLITQTDHEFPNSHGHFTLSNITDKILEKYIDDYIQSWVELEDFAQNGNVYNDDYFEQLTKHEEKFLELIGAKDGDWQAYRVDTDFLFNICCPIFYDYDKVSIR